MLAGQRAVDGDVEAPGGEGGGGAAIFLPPGLGQLLPLPSDARRGMTQRDD